ncbi:hypothetical protein SAMN04487917_103152 [Arthrobacter sp. yr096]|uniref:hypothetical protein n=1 Tax=Arthrobacter sp. yr096 TaxID=1761750 RepID=UPI0008ACB27A|nr:hypothetical protein [Arthrobacter sp. yr096]SEI96500.1 hypothetical protein SAMN04487917_103152 [Arthrobacter sp. yr096]
MGITFDDGAADALIRAANSADEVMRAEGGFLTGSVDQALQHFKGGYARLFEAACGIRSDDRGRLAGVLTALADDVREARLRAQQEKARQKELAAWRQRDDVRKQVLNRRRITATVFAACSVFLLVSGCFPTTPGNSDTANPSSSQSNSTSDLPISGEGTTMTPEAAGSELFGLLDEIQAMAPGEWTNKDVPAGGYCNFQGTGGGKEFGGSRTRGPLGDTERETLGQKVEEFYKSSGYDVKVFDQSTATNKLIITNGFGPDGLVLQVYTGDLGTTVAGNSRCVADPQGK